MSESSQWLPIEGAPKDGTEVFVGVDIAGTWVSRGARFVHAHEWVPGDDGDTDGWWSFRNSVSQEKLEGIYAPTHYCPMPEFLPSQQPSLQASAQPRA